jgi:hypothetical protein
MSNSRAHGFILLLAVWLPWTALAQSSGNARGQSQPPDEGVSGLGYTIHQSVDLGYRYKQPGRQRRHV